MKDFPDFMKSPAKGVAGTRTIHFFGGRRAARSVDRS